MSTPSTWKITWLFGRGQHDVDRVVRVREDRASARCSDARRHDDAMPLDRIEDGQRPDRDPVVVGRGSVSLSPSNRVSTPVRIGRASSLAAAKATSASARLRTFWLTRVVGRSPAEGMTGNSSASMPRRWVW